MSSSQHLAQWQPLWKMWGGKGWWTLDWMILQQGPCSLSCQSLSALLTRIWDHIISQGSLGHLTTMVLGDPKSRSCTHISPKKKSALEGWAATVEYGDTLEVICTLAPSVLQPPSCDLHPVGAGDIPCEAVWVICNPMEPALLFLTGSSNTERG